MGRYFVKPGSVEAWQVNSGEPQPDWITFSCMNGFFLGPWVSPHTLVDPDDASPLLMLEDGKVPIHPDTWLVLDASGFIWIYGKEDFETEYSPVTEPLESTSEAAVGT